MHYARFINPNENVNQFFGNSNTFVYGISQICDVPNWKNISTIELKSIKLDDYLEEGKSTNDERRQSLCVYF